MRVDLDEIRPVTQFNDDIKMKSKKKKATYLEFCNVPIRDLRIRRII